MVADDMVARYGLERSVYHAVDETELRQLLSDFFIHAVEMHSEQFENCTSAEWFVSAEKL